MESEFIALVLTKEEHARLKDLLGLKPPTILSLDFQEPNLDDSLYLKIYGEEVDYV